MMLINIHIYLGFHFLKWVFFCILLFENENSKCFATNKRRIFTLTINGFHLSLKTQNGQSTCSAMNQTKGTFQTSIGFYVLNHQFNRALKGWCVELEHGGIHVPCCKVCDLVFD